MTRATPNYTATGDGADADKAGESPPASHRARTIRASKSKGSEAVGAAHAAVGSSGAPSVEGRLRGAPERLVGDGVHVANVGADGGAAVRKKASPGGEGVLEAARRWAPLLGLWAVVTLYNLFKPFHIDDAAHLEIARWIGGHPLHPMSGKLNWVGFDDPIWYTNQPHLYFALLAAWGKIFGFSELAMHVFQSVSSLACVVLFHRIARFVAPSAALWATAMVILGPAFIVEQNLMVDVPLLALWLTFFNLIVCGGQDRQQTRRFVLAGLACSAAILTKYSSLTLLPIFAAALLVERRKAQAWTFLIPIGAIFAWSLFNYFDYGRIHMLTHARDAGPYARRPLVSTISWAIGLGALTPLGLIAAAQSRWTWRVSGWRFYALVGTAFGVLAASVAAGMVSDALSDRVLMAAFAANVALMALALVLQLIPLMRAPPWKGPPHVQAAPMTYIWLWLLGTTAFYVLLSPFIASRHILLIVPAVTLILAARWGASLTRASKIFGLAITVVVSTGLCVSDWRFADFYRAEAAALRQTLHGPGAMWASGHWGWQWYAEQKGFPQVDVRASPLKPGDLLLVGREVDHENVLPQYALRLVRVDTQDHPLVSLICAGRPARFYAFSYRQGPWSLSRSCLNHLDVYRVDRTQR